MASKSMEREFGKLRAACCEPLRKILEIIRPSNSVVRTSNNDELPSHSRTVSCGRCGRVVDEFSKGERGVSLCRPCLRIEDEEKLNHRAPLTAEEKNGLDLVASVIDAVSWKKWKPGDQPAKILDWLYLGDLKEAMNFDLLASKGITAVTNLINWWELSSRLGDVDLEGLYASHGIVYQEEDSEDRLFFDMIKNSWPVTEEFLSTCRDEGRCVLVNCYAGHNRSACMVVCWLVVHEHLSLLEALDQVLTKRGPILSNHGFRLQLVRLALQLQRLGDMTDSTSTKHDAKVGGLQSAVASDRSHGAQGSSLLRIISDKRLTVKYDHNSMDYSALRNSTESTVLAKTLGPKGALSIISEKVGSLVNQRMLSMELIACLVHWNANFISDYEYTNLPPVVIGSGFNGDVVLCQRRDANVRGTRPVACVKRFQLDKMGSDNIEKLKNEAVIYLSLEHPHIARLFDVYEDESELSLVMEYCSGGTLADVLREREVFGETDFKEAAVQMMRAVRYIHKAGIVHRDIKPRNFVYEGDSQTLKLIDFGFSVESLGADSGVGLKGCLGTLGYLAPEVVCAGTRETASYTEKCDIWSLGAVFYELLVGKPAFDREQGSCDGYTRERVLREIQDVTADRVESLLLDAPEAARPFLRRLLTTDVDLRPSAREALDDPYVVATTMGLSQPTLPIGEILSRFRACGESSTPSRALRVAKARSPTNLPFNEFRVLRATFDMFARQRFDGTVNLKDFLSVIAPGDEEVRVREACKIWEAVCPEQESLSYCEFLAALLPAEEDVFEDVHDTSRMLREVTLANNLRWTPSAPISQFLPMLHSYGKPIDGIFNEDVPTCDVVHAMSQAHYHWVIVRYHDGKHQFFDYMDINHQLVSASSLSCGITDMMAQIMSMPVGAIANCSGHSTFVKMSVNEPLSKVLQLIAQPLPDLKEASRQARTKGLPRQAFVRRVPIVGDNEEVFHVFSCTDFLDLSVRFPATSAVLRARSARAFDCRDTMMSVSVINNDSVTQALQIMDASSLTICPVTSRELSGSMGGVVAMNVVSAADLKWVMNLGEFRALDQSVGDFIAWRSNCIAANEESAQRAKSLGRFNVVSVDADDSLHILTSQMLASKLQRIFLSSREIARIVGIVSSRDILLEVLGQLAVDAN